jgi:hypothetical protein
MRPTTLRSRISLILAVGWFVLLLAVIVGVALTAERYSDCARVEHCGRSQGD